jgi:hypothetical protein
MNASSTAQTDGGFAPSLTGSVLLQTPALTGIPHPPATPGTAPDRMQALIPPAGARDVTHRADGATLGADIL